MRGKKKTHEEFISELYSIVGDEYLVLSKYVAFKKKIHVRHNVCGYEYDVRASGILSDGRRCPKCSGKTRKTTEVFKEEVFNLVADEYTVLGEYKNNSTNIQMIHNTCGHRFNTVPVKFLQGRRCEKCLGTLRKTSEEFQCEIDRLADNEYELISDYINAKEKVSLLHKKCNNIWEVRPNDFTSGNQRCPVCSCSKGEDEIMRILDEYKVNYVSQYSFSQYESVKYQRYDFAIIDSNKDVLMLIEYDGEQHYKFIEYFHKNEDGFKIQKERDKRKDDFAKDMNIPLLRIRYDEDIYTALKCILKPLEGSYSASK